MKLVLLIASVILIIIGAIFGYSYTKRKQQNFDEKCNNYFVVSISCLIASVTLSIIEVLLALFSIF